VNNAQQFKIDFEPVGKRIKIREDQSLLDASHATGIQLSALCGGYGTCGACKVRLMDGQLSPHTSI
jgi:Na+-transporting NADH:ubiquinone oxidoreductase subunit F